MSDAVTRLNAALEGRYRIERQLGEGGMATVYGAHDLKHERRVALKVLKPALAAVVGAERFLAEIKTTANLHHPNILPLFDSGEADGFLYYVMPLVEGESLRDQIERERQLPVDAAVRIARAVAAALEHAHARGVFHRDIKPANILLQDGEPLVSDFGIALAVDAGGGRLTETGLSVGTPFYMSPEQATGDRPVGSASDTYSLGCVLYEMLVGEPPYGGATAQSVLAKIILGGFASVSEARPTVPPNVDAAIRKALEKLPADRFASTKDFAAALADPSFRHGEVVAAGSPTSWTRLTTGFAVLTGILGVAFGWALTRQPSVEPQEVVRVDLTEEVPLGVIMPLLAPDGSYTLFNAVGPSGQLEVWIRRWSELAPRPIPGATGVVGTISPDGREFTVNPTWPAPLRVYPIEGGPARTLVEEDNWGGGVWSSDGWVYFTTSTAAGVGAGVARVPEGGGQPETVTELRVGELAHGLYDIHPHGRVALLVVFYALGGAGNAVWALDLESGERTRLVEGTAAYFTSSGELIYVTGAGTLMRAPFDAGALEMGQPLPILEGVATGVTLGEGMLRLSDRDDLLYMAAASTEILPAWGDRSGLLTDTLSAWAGGVEPMISPEGDRIAVLRDGNIYVEHLDGRPAVRITSTGGVVDRNPSWSPDGESLLFLSDRTAPGSGMLEIFSVRADGGGTPALVHSDPRGVLGAAWSPDGEWIVYATALQGPTGSDIYGIRPGSEEGPVELLAGPGIEAYPRVSPDGRYLAATVDWGVIVVPFPNTNEARFTVGGTKPRWSADGSELFYLTMTGAEASPESFTVHVARVDTSESFRIVGTEELSTHAALGSTPLNPFFDLHPDGQRYLVPIEGATTPLRLIFVRNWGQELLARPDD